MEAERPVRRLAEKEVRLLDSSSGRGGGKRGWLWAMGLADRVYVVSEEKRGMKNVL